MVYLLGFNRTQKGHVIGRLNGGNTFLYIRRTKSLRFNFSQRKSILGNFSEDINSGPLIGFSIYNNFIKEIGFLSSSNVFIDLITLWPKDYMIKMISTRIEVTRNEFSHLKNQTATPSFVKICTNIGSLTFSRKKSFYFNSKDSWINIVDNLTSGEELVKRVSGPVLNPLEDVFSFINFYNESDLITFHNSTASEVKENLIKLARYNLLLSTIGTHNCGYQQEGDLEWDFSYEVKNRVRRALFLTKNFCFNSPDRKVIINDRNVITNKIG